MAYSLVKRVLLWVGRDRSDSFSVALLPVHTPSPSADNQTTPGEIWTEK